MPAHTRICHCHCHFIQYSTQALCDDMIHQCAILNEVDEQLIAMGKAEPTLTDLHFDTRRCMLHDARGRIELLELVLSCTDKECEYLEY